MTKSIPWIVIAAMAACALAALITRNDWWIYGEIALPVGMLWVVA